MFFAFADSDATARQDLTGRVARHLVVINANSRCSVGTWVGLREEQSASLNKAGKSTSREDARGIKRELRPLFRPTAVVVLIVAAIRSDASNHVPRGVVLVS